MSNCEYNIRHPCDVSDLKREKTCFYDRNHKESDRFIVSQIWSSDTAAAKARQEFFVKLQFRGKVRVFLRIKRFKEETY